MEFEYTGRHVDVTPALRAHVEEHFGKIDHLFRRSTTARAHAITDVLKNRHLADNLLHRREHTLTAKDTTADMYQALTRCIDKIEKQAVKLKKKIIERKQTAAPLSSVAPDETGTTASAENVPQNAPRIIAARRYRVKPMTPEEAAMTLARRPS